MLEGWWMMYFGLAENCGFGGGWVLRSEVLCTGVGEEKGGKNGGEKWRRC